MRLMAVALVLLLGSGCGDECSCGLPPGDDVLDIVFSEWVGPGTATVCAGQCVSVEHGGGDLRSVGTTEFTTGWQRRMVTVEVTSSSTDESVRFLAGPPVQRESCCGPVWTIEQPEV